MKNLCTLRSLLINNHHDQIEVTLVASFPLHLSLAVQNALHEAFEHDYIGVVS